MVESCCAPASSSSLLWGKAFKLRGENFRGATSSDLAASQTGRSRWNHQKSSEITHHQTSTSNHLRTWKNPPATYATYGDSMGQHWTTIFRFLHILYFAFPLVVNDSTLPPCQDTTKFRLGDIQQLAASATQGHRDLWDVDGWDVASSTLLWEEDDEHDSWWHVYLYTIWLWLT